MSLLKKQIGDIVMPRIISVSPDTKTAEVIQTMRTHQISCVPVLQEQKPLGIFTEREIVRYASQWGTAFSGKTIRDLMTSPVLTVTQNTPLYEAFGILLSHNIRHLVVVDEQGEGIGVITQSDLLAHLGYENFIEVKKIAHIMRKNVYSVHQEAIVAHVLSDMAAQSISCAVVAENRIPVGIVTERDIAGLIAENADIHDLPVREVMSHPVHTVTALTTIYDAAHFIRQQHIRRLVVVNEQGELSGLITQSDILKGLEGEYIEILRNIITEQHLELQDTSQALYHKTMYLDNMLRSSLDLGIVMTDVDLTIRYYNPATREILMYTPQQVIGRNVKEFHEREQIDEQTFQDVITSIREHHRRHHFHFERMKGEETRTIEANVSGIWDSKDHLMGFVLTVKDVTERKKSEETIQYLAYHDTLTGLCNRPAFRERFALELRHAERGQGMLALMILDLNLFKQVNDTFGHQVGDELLTSFADRVGRTIRKSDTFARIGGDEFVLLLPDIHDAADAFHIATKIMLTLDPPFRLHGHDLNLTVSIGIALYPGNGTDEDTLFSAADHAMYHAKQQNRQNAESNVSFARM